MMSDSLIERVAAARETAEAANPIGSASDWSREQKAAILIAQVQAIVAGDEPAASEEALAKVDKAAGEVKTVEPPEPTTGL
jgi:hypothetical protein